MLAVFVALAAEAQCLEPHLAERQSPRLGKLPIITGQYGGRSVLLCRTGPGRRAEAIAAQVLERHPAKGVVSLGFAGALVPHLKASELLLCEEVFNAEARDGPDPTQAVRSQPLLLALAEAAAQRQGLAHRRAASVTVPQAIASPEAKRTLARTWPALLVEMESFWVGRVAAARGIPFLALRAVVDELDDWVPDVSLVDDSGAVQGQKVAAYLLRHPERAQDLIRLAANVAKASDSLKAGALAFLEQWNED